MSTVRVIGRIRPLVGKEEESDIIVSTDGTSVKIPNPKNDKENYTFAFNTVFDSDADQAKIFAEIQPTIKHLFKGNDVTVFAYGNTGSGKTYTMRGGKPVAERGIIPRLLAAIFRKGKEMERKSDGESAISVDMSYYEIYNDKVFDLFEPPEKRSLAGLPLREHDKKTVVVGLTEKRIASLKEFETLYDTANSNRTTFATKLNAHSSRSHAIMAVKLTIEDKKVGRARQAHMSAIDLAGSEDNRRTANDKERMTESASINKSLFVLAQCVEAISKKQARIPYRESKMTRILSLGQNNGMTVMILNIAPTKACHLDTLNCLNFANRTKKIEVKEVQNAAYKTAPSIETSEMMQRQALRPMSGSGNMVNKLTTSSKLAQPLSKRSSTEENKSSLKRASNGDKVVKSGAKLVSQPLKKLEPLKTKTSAKNIPVKPHSNNSSAGPSEKEIALIVERKVEELLAAKAASEKQKQSAPAEDISEKVNKRLEELEKKLEGRADARAEGISFLLLGKQHQARGENLAALKMYELALPFFPDNPKLLQKISALKSARQSDDTAESNPFDAPAKRPASKKSYAVFADPADASNISIQEIHHEEDDPFAIPAHPPPSKPAGQKRKKAFMVYQEIDGPSPHSTGTGTNTPRTHRLLAIINSDDVQQIKLLKGVGPKKAETLVQHVREHRMSEPEGKGLESLKQLAELPGIGSRSVEAMRAAIAPEGVENNVVHGGKKAKKEKYDDDADYEGSPVSSGRKRSRTLMSRKEMTREVVRDYVGGMA